MKTVWRRWASWGQGRALLCNASRLKFRLCDMTGPVLQSKAISSHFTVPACNTPDDSAQARVQLPFARSGSNIQSMLFSHPQTERAIPELVCSRRALCGWVTCRIAFHRFCSSRDKFRSWRFMCCRVTSPNMCTSKLQHAMCCAIAETAL